MKKRMKMKYKIAYLTLTGNIFTYTVDSYKVVDGDMIEFFDKIRKEPKKLHASRCEITEVKE